MASFRDEYLIMTIVLIKEPYCPPLPLCTRSRYGIQPDSKTRYLPPRPRVRMIMVYPLFLRSRIILISSTTPAITPPGAGFGRSEPPMCPYHTRVPGVRPTSTQFDDRTFRSFLLLEEDKTYWRERPGAASSLLKDLWCHLAS